MKKMLASLLIVAILCIGFATTVAAESPFARVSSVSQAEFMIEELIESGADLPSTVISSERTDLGGGYSVVETVKLVSITELGLPKNIATALASGTGYVSIMHEFYYALILRRAFGVCNARFSWNDTSAVYDTSVTSHYGSDVPIGGDESNRSGWVVTTSAVHSNSNKTLTLTSVCYNELGEYWGTRVGAVTVLPGGGMDREGDT